MNYTSQVRPRQRDRILALLKAHEPAWVSLPEILALGIAQYNARIFELRSIGHRIESRQQGDRSWFRLVTALASTPIPETSGAGRTMVYELSSRPSIEPPTAAESLFADLAPERHRDDG